MKIRFSVDKQQRKNFVAAIAQELGTESRYMGMPSMGFAVGDYLISKDGVLSGPDNRELTAKLSVTHGFWPTEEEYDTPPPSLEDLAELELQMGDSAEKPERRGIMDIIVDELNASAAEGEHWERLHSTPQMECGDGRWRNIDGTYAATTRTGGVGEDNGEMEPLTDLNGLTDTPAADVPTDETAENLTSDTLAIEFPMTGFTAEKLENLSKMVTSKAPLIMAALGVESLPIQHLGDRISLPWFTETLDAPYIQAYTTFISRLCITARAKQRVTAKERPIEGSPKYAMRCFLLSIGMIGSEFKESRKLLLEKLGGSGAFKEFNKARLSFESDITDVNADNNEAGCGGDE